MDALIVDLIHRVEADIAELRAHVHAHASDSVAHAGSDHTHDEYATLESVAALAVATSEVISEVAEDVAEVAEDVADDAEEDTDDVTDDVSDDVEDSAADVTDASVEVAPVRPHALHQSIGG